MCEVLKAFMAQHYIDKFITVRSLDRSICEIDEPALMLALMEQCGHRINR